MEILQFYNCLNVKIMDTDEMVGHNEPLNDQNPVNLDENMIYQKNMSYYVLTTCIENRYVMII